MAYSGVLSLPDKFLSCTLKMLRIHATMSDLVSIEKLEVLTDATTEEIASVKFGEQ